MDICLRVCVALSLFVFVSCSGGGGGGESRSPSNAVNQSPILTSGLEAVFPQTRTGTVYTIQASDPNDDQLTYSVSGADAASFNVDETTGAMTFVVAPDVDRPGSVDNDNFYFIDVRADDPSGAFASQQVIIEVSRHDPDGPFVFSEGAVFLGPDTIVPSDPSILLSVSFFATETRSVPDNRLGNNADKEMYVYDAVYASGKSLELVVNTEIQPLSDAEAEAQRYAFVLGQLDPLVLQGIDIVVIHGGTAAITGFPGGFVIHTETVANDFLPRGVLEELVIHESVHGALDVIYLDTPQWLQAQESDIRFVTEYARAFPETEDLAESYGAYLIAKNASRNSPSLVQQIEEGIPARIVFFQSVGL